MDPSQSSQLVSAFGPHVVTRSIPSSTLNAVNIKHLEATPKKTPTSSMSPTSVQFADTPSDEESGPLSPRSGPISNFGVVATGIYRSAFLFESNIDHLEALRLRTLITLVATPFDGQTSGFLLDSNIKHYRIVVPAHKERNGRQISYDDIGQIMRLITNPCNHPVLIHCNKGKHRTGCIVAAFRAVAAFNDCRDWAPPSRSDVLSEYRRFSAPKNRELDEEFITRFDPRRVLFAQAAMTRPIQPTKFPNPEDPNDMFGLIEEWSRTEPGVKYVSASPSESSGLESQGSCREACVWGDWRASQPAERFDACSNLCGVSVSPVKSKCAMRRGECSLDQERDRVARKTLEDQL